MDAVATFQALIDRYLASYTAHDARGCAAVYAEDAAVHSPYSQPAIGRPAIEATHRDWFEDGETNKSMRVTHAGIGGDMGFCFVEYAADLPVDGGAVERARGTSLNVMERRGDGDWTITLASLNERQD